MNSVSKLEEVHAEKKILEVLSSLILCVFYLVDVTSFQLRVFGGHV